MSSLWTPDGERPIRREPAGAPPPSPQPSIEDWDDEQEMSPEDEAQLAAMQAELASTPAAAIVANHCVGLFNLAALHLSQTPPNLGEATLAIDALGAIADACRGRLGADEPDLIEAVRQIRLAFVQIQAGMG